MSFYIVSDSAPVRTFGDLRRKHPSSGAYCQCSFCKRRGLDVEKLYKYSTRHYVCDTCIEPRKEVILPRIRRREKLNARMRAFGATGDVL